MAFESPDSRELFQPTSASDLILGAISVEEAKRLKSEFIEPEHILLALITAEKSKDMPPVFERLNLDALAIRRDLLSVINVESGKPTPIDPDLSEDATTAVVFAFNESHERNLEKPTTIDLLIGLVRLANGVAPIALANNGLNKSRLDELRQLARKLNDPFVIENYDSTTLQTASQERDYVRANLDKQTFSAQK